MWCQGRTKDLNFLAKMLYNVFLLSIIAVATTGSQQPTRTPSDVSIAAPSEPCPNSEAWCSNLGENEKLAFEAIYALHHQLDDDKNGNIDLFESNEVSF